MTIALLVLGLLSADVVAADGRTGPETPASGRSLAATSQEPSRAAGSWPASGGSIRAIAGPTPDREPPPETSTIPPAPSTAPSTAPAPVVTAPAPVPTTPPPPPPTTVPGPPPTTEPPGETLQERVERAYRAGVPAMWRDTIAVQLSVIEGRTSWAEGGGKIMIARSHAEGAFDHLADVVAHEFGHQVAFEFGTKAYPGAAPAGWPEPAENPAEAWADCVQQVFTGRTSPSHGLAPCRGEQFGWAADWLSSVPEAPSD